MLLCIFDENLFIIPHQRRLFFPSSSYHLFNFHVNLPNQSSDQINNIVMNIQLAHAFGAFLIFGFDFLIAWLTFPFIFTLMSEFNSNSFSFVVNTVVGINNWPQPKVYASNCESIQKQENKWIHSKLEVFFSSTKLQFVSQKNDFFLYFLWEPFWMIW